MNDPRSEYWSRILDAHDEERDPVGEVLPPKDRTHPRAADLDRAVHVSDGGPGKNAVALLRMNGGRFMYIKVVMDADGAELSRSVVAGTRPRCEMTIDNETRRRFGMNLRLE